MVTKSSDAGLLISVGVTSTALLLFGYIKGRFTGTQAIKTAVQTLVIGGIAAGVAFALAKAISR